LGNLREIYHKEEPGVDGRRLLRRFFRKWRHELELAGSG
jgi:hypothetical protein